MKKLLLSFLLTCSLISYTFAQVVITEIFYNAPGSDTIEFIELYNNSAGGVNLTGWNFTRGITYTFSGVFMSPGQYLIVARDANSFQTVFGTQTVYEWTEGSLSNSGESIVLVNPAGVIQDTVRYNTSAPWPTGPIDPDGGGGSIVLCDPDTDNNDPLNWTSGDLPTGTFIDGVQLFAHPGTTCPGIDLIPPIPQNAYAISQDQVVVEFNEALNGTAENVNNYGNINAGTGTLDATDQIVTLNLATPLQDGVLTTITVSNVQDALGNAMATTEEFDIIWHSTGEVRDIVITEIMYNSPGNDSLDFIELYNNSGIPRNLVGCYFEQGFDFVFPEVVMQPGDFIIIAEDSVNFEITYGITPFKWSGQLDNNSEKIIFNFVDGDTIDFVDYNDNNGWPELADGEGHSLVLCDVDADNNDTLSWQIASTFTGITIGDTLDMFANPGAMDPCPPIGIKDVEELEGIYIYPNPNTGMFIVENEASTLLEYQIRDLLGRNIQEGQLRQNSEQLNLGEVSKGIYLISLQDPASGRRTSQKILIQ